MRRINDTPRLSNLHRECRGAPGQPPGVHREVRNMLRDIAARRGIQAGESDTPHRPLVAPPDG